MWEVADASTIITSSKSNHPETESAHLQPHMFVIATGEEQVQKGGGGLSWR